MTISGKNKQAEAPALAPAGQKEQGERLPARQRPTGPGGATIILGDKSAGYKGACSTRLPCLAAFIPQIYAARESAKRRLL